MSYWAWYFVKDERGTHAYCDRWGARRYCCHWLFWGPDVLPGMIRGLEPEIREPVTPDWAEGGMAVDLPARKLTWFCESPVHDCLSIQRVLLALQRVLWSGWEVVWAARGLDDLLRAVQLPQIVPDFEAREARMSETVYMGPDKPLATVRELYDLEFPKRIDEPKEEPLGVASILGSDLRRKVLPLRDSELEFLFGCGPTRLLGAFEKRDAHPVVTLKAEPAWQRAQAGIDLNVPNRVMCYWSSETFWSGIDKNLWAGWTIIDWGDDYQKHEALLEGRLKVELSPATETLKMLREFLVPDCPKYEPYEIEIADDEYGKAEFPLTLLERERRWELAVSKAFPDQEH